MLDSSVLVAGLRSRNGASFRLLELLRDDRFEVALSVPLALEYEEVLLRHADELRLGKEAAIGLVDFLCKVAHHQAIHYLWRPSLRDAQDELVLELAVAAGCEAIVTHNVRDFAPAATHGISVLTPASFLVVVEDQS